MKRLFCILLTVTMLLTLSLSASAYSLWETDQPGVTVNAVTVDEAGRVNFPYLYPRRLRGPAVDTRKRFSFCCTPLSNAFLSAYSFDLLDPEKQWFDVSISHRSLELGFRNRLLLNAPVLHRPHSSRPWKRLKYTNPLRYYWQKLTQHRDRI